MVGLRLVCAASAQVLGGFVALELLRLRFVFPHDSTRALCCCTHRSQLGKNTSVLCLERAGQSACRLS